MFVHVQPNLPPLPTDVSTLFNQGHLTIIYEWPTPCYPLTPPTLNYGTHHHPQILQFSQLQIPHHRPLDASPCHQPLAPNPSHQGATPQMSH